MQVSVRLYPEEVQARLEFELDSVVYVDTSINGKCWLILFPQHEGHIPVESKDLGKQLEKSELVEFEPDRWINPKYVKSILRWGPEVLRVVTDHGPFDVFLQKDESRADCYQRIREKLADHVDLPPTVWELPAIL